MSSVELLNQYKARYPQRSRFVNEDFDYGMRSACGLFLTAPNGKQYLSAIQWLKAEPLAFEVGVRALARPNKRRLKKWLRR